MKVKMARISSNSILYLNLRVEPDSLTAGEASEICSRTLSFGEVSIATSGVCNADSVARFSVTSAGRSVAATDLFTESLNTLVNESLSK